MTGTAAILAGGASSRFGSPKALHLIHGRPMATIVADRLKPHFRMLFLAGWPAALTPPPGIDRYPDFFSGRAALGGIHTALTNTAEEWVFCCGCDMPLVQPTVVSHLIDQIDDEDILIPLINGVRQPLHAIYKRRLLPLVEHLCNTGEAFLPHLFEEATVRSLDETAFSSIPNYHLSFVSINTQQDLSAYAPFLESL